MIDGRRNGLKRVRNLPKNLAVRCLNHIFIRKSRNFLVTVQHHSHVVAAGAFVEKIVMRPALQSETTSVCATMRTALERSENKCVVESSRLDPSMITKR